MTHRRSGVLQLAAFAALLALAHPLTLTAGNGDYDLDNDIDWDDFAYWAGCMTGEQGSFVAPYVALLND